MRYLMFAKTDEGSEFCRQIKAADDFEAENRFLGWLEKEHGVAPARAVTVAGVWEKDPKFHTAECLSDLED